MAEDMRVRNFADATIDAYTYHVDRFCRHFGKPADLLGQEEIRQFQLFLVNEKKVSWSSFNQAVCGLRFLYEVTLDRPWQVRHIPFGKRPKTLADAFRGHYLAGLRRLFRQGRLKIDAEKQPKIRSQPSREAWLKQLETQHWNVYLQGPPQSASRPEHVLKYLARYMTGGPIANSRIIQADARTATFWARSRDGDNQSRPFTLQGHEFVRRWAMHILPKNFTKSRSYGGYHTTKRADYLQRCRELLPTHEANGDTKNRQASDQDDAPKSCPRCSGEMTVITDCPRPSWQHVLTVAVYESPEIYCPLLHVPHGGGRAPPRSNHQVTP